MAILQALDTVHNIVCDKCNHKPLTTRTALVRQPLQNFKGVTVHAVKGISQVRPNPPTPFGTTMA